jgi:hypothetical protein
MSFIINPYAFGFNPLSLNPALWLSDTGSDPSVWLDLSGNGRNGTQVASERRPSIVASGLNGRQVRRFDGVDDFMYHGYSGSLSGSFSIFIVVKLLSIGTGYRCVFSCGNASQGSLLLTKISTAKWGTYTAVDAPATTTLATGQAMVLTMIDSAAAGGLFYLNGISDGTWAGNSAGQTDAQVGGSGNIGQSQNCDIAEVLVYPTALSTTNRQAVESYLRTKWGTP